MRRLVVATLVLLVVAGACTDGPEPEASPSPSPAPSVEVVESSEDRLPEGFPEDFPLPEERTVLYSQVPGDQGWVVYFDTPLPADQLVAFFGERLPAQGWTLYSCTTADRSPEPVSAVIALKDTLSATIQIGFIPAERVPFEGRYAFVAVVVTTPEPLPAPTGPPAVCQ